MSQPGPSPPRRRGPTKRGGKSRKHNKKKSRHSRSPKHKKKTKMKAVDPAHSTADDQEIDNLFWLGEEDDIQLREIFLWYARHIRHKLDGGVYGTEFIGSITRHRCQPPERDSDASLTTLDRISIYQRDQVPLGKPHTHVKTVWHLTQWDVDDGFPVSTQEVKRKADFAKLQLNVDVDFSPYYLYSLPVFGEYDKYCYLSSREQRCISYNTPQCSLITRGFTVLREQGVLPIRQETNFDDDDKVNMDDGCLSYPPCSSVLLQSSPRLASMTPEQPYFSPVAHSPELAHNTSSSSPTALQVPITLKSYEWSPQDFDSDEDSMEEFPAGEDEDIDNEYKELQLSINADRVNQVLDFGEDNV